MPSALSRYSANDFRKALVAWGFVPDPSRNVGDHMAYRHPETGAVVSFSNGGRWNKAGVPFRVIKKAMAAAPDAPTDFTAFLQGPPKVKTEENTTDVLDVPVLAEPAAATVAVASPNGEAMPKQRNYPANRAAPGAVSEAIVTVLNRDPRTSMDIPTIVRETGLGEKSVGNALVKLVGKGLVERPERGLYRAANAQGVQAPARHGQVKRAVLEALDAAGGEPVKVEMLCELTDREERSVRNALNYLVSKGEVQSLGRRQYKLTNAPTPAPEKPADVLPFEEAPSEDATGYSLNEIRTMEGLDPVEAPVEAPSVPAEAPEPAQGTSTDQHPPAPAYGPPILHFEEVAVLGEDGVLLRDDAGNLWQAYRVQITRA